MAAAINGATRLAARLARVAEASVPLKTATGSWQKPEWSRRKIADLKKAAALEGLAWPLPEPKRKPMKFLVQPPKGHKAEREAAKRQALIKANMERMPQILAEFRREQQEAKEKKRPELPF